LSGARTTVDRTEADEESELERNRVAWNLPRAVTRAPVTQAPEAGKNAEPLSHDDTPAAGG
jgi:hypothetical protein